MMKNNIRRVGIGVGVAVFWLGLWTLVCWIANQTLLMPLPYPWDVAVSLMDLIGRGDFGPMWLSRCGILCAAFWLR